MAGQNLDFDQECFTRANVAHSRAANLTILACPLNMQGMPGALQALAALLMECKPHTPMMTEITIQGSLDLTAIQVRNATAAFHQALLPHEFMGWPSPCLLGRAS